jgi:regulatory protein
VKKIFTPEQAYPKIKQYCGYQERCHFEVKERLFAMNLPKKEVETLLSRLIEENLVNEERYAIQFAGGHFRQKKWGKVKISYELRQKRIGETLIKTAMKEIEGVDYRATLQKLAFTKWKSLKGQQHLSREVKTIAYLLQKGYERPIVQEMITLLRSGSAE